MSILGNAAAGNQVTAMTEGTQPDTPQVTATPEGAPPSQAAPAAPAPTSRLQAIISAVAKVGTTAMAGIPDRGRPSFVTGLGEGARSEQQAVANQQAIRFKSFDDQVRLSQLHNQDLKMQQDTQAQQDAHTKAELDNRAMANSLGINYDTIASDGKAVMDHLTSQTAATGSASVPPGTHLSGDGESINIPRNDQATQDGQKRMYELLAPALGLSPLPPGAQFVPPKNMNMLTNKIHGYDIAGNPIKHDDLQTAIGTAQANRDQLAKNGATPQQLQAVDNMIGIYKANLNALDEHAESVRKAQKQGDLDLENSPANVQAKANTAAQVEQAKLTVTNSPSNQAAAAKGAGLKASAEQSAKNLGILDSVAFDPNYQNPDGTKGANVVMSKEDASAKGLNFYKADPNKINTVVAGMNDVQTKLNQLASITTDPTRMGQVQAGLAAALLAHGKGIQADFHGVGIDTSRVNEISYANDLKLANQATKDYVTAMVGAHEAITQLPRLQTFGQSNRMTEKQMEAAVNLLPQPGDGTMASQKMTSLQGMIDPLRKQIPRMPGASVTPSWLETRQQQQRQQTQTRNGGSNLGRVVSGNATDIINGLR
jgi:hypothetical protein